MVDALRSRAELATGPLYRRLARNSAYLAGGMAASALFMMLAAVVNARALSAREFGLLVLFQSATMLVATLMSFATQQPIIKLGASALADGNLEQLGRIIGLGLLLDALAAVVATIIAILFLWLGRDLVGLGSSKVGLAIPFAFSLLFTGYLTSNGIFRLLNRFGLLSVIQAGCAAGILAATAYLYAIHAPFAAYCWAWAIFYALNAQLPLFTALVLTRRAKIPVHISTTRMQQSDVRTFFAYCWTTWGMATADTIRSNGDSLLVGAMVSVEAAGIYNVAKQLAGVLRKANTVYASAMFPEVSALSAHGEADSAKRVQRRILWMSGLIGAAAVIVTVLLGRPLLTQLFGIRFGLAYLPLIILTAAAASQLISHTLSMYVQVYVGPERLFRAYVFAVGVFLVAAVPLTSFWSIDGMAVAQLLFALALIYFCHSALRGTRAA